MTPPNYPQQPGPYPPPGPPRPQYGPPPGQQPPQYGQPPGQPLQYGPPPGQQAPPRPQYGPPPGQQPPPYPPPGGTQQPPPYTPPGGMQQATAPPPPYPDPPDSPPTKRGVGSILGKKLLRIVIGLVVAGGVAAVALYFNRDEPSKAAVGDCIVVKNEANADLKKVDCNTPDAVYKVGKKLASSTAECPSRDYVTYTETGGKDDFALCLVLNAKEGDCFTNTKNSYVRAACATAEFKVGKVVTGSADAERACGAENAQNAMTYPEPPTAICLVAPK